MPRGKGKGKRRGGSGGGSKGGSPSKGHSSSTASSSKGSPSVPLSPAEELKRKGNDEFQQGNFKRAVQLYTESLNAEPEVTAVLSNRSAANLKLKELESAMSDADECIRLAPQWWKGYVRKSNVLAEQGDFSSAFEVLRQGKDVCSDVKQLDRACGELETKQLSGMSKKDRIVGGVHTQTDKFRRMFEWLFANNAKFPKLYLKFYTTEFRSMHTMSRMEKDEEVMYIPHDTIMTSEVARSSPIGQAILSSGVELRSKHSFLACYLLHEKAKGEASFWFPYIDILPETFETVPIFFGEEQRQELTGSIALQKIDDRIESLRLEYDAICEHVPEFGRKFTHDQFVWGRLVVITRIFGMVIDGVKTDGLVPLADMLNHKRPRETKWTYEQKRRGFVVTTLMGIKENTEVFDSYGRKCNSRFFVNYGFSLEYNLDNEALLIFELNKSDPQYGIKARHLGFTSHDSVYHEFQIPMHYKEKKVKECFSWYRVAHAQGPEFMVISSVSVSDGIAPLSIRNEKSVLMSLAVAATKSLKKFETTLEHDNLLLADEKRFPRFSNERNIVLMRRGEKEVLTFYANLYKEVMPLFKMSIKEFKSTLRKEKRWKDADAPLVQYVMEVVYPLITKKAHPG